jgi:hypothetical protein
MRHRLLWAIVGIPLALLTVMAGTALALPAARNIASAWWNVPDRLPAYAGNSQIHFEVGADDYARDVAALLPAALARIEAVQGRPFAHPVTIGVYATPRAYMAATVPASMGPVGVTNFGRVNLSPTLASRQHRRLPAILTHELSHAHIQGWIGLLAEIKIPNWFKEGLAVMVSGGGGAEFVSEQEARASIAGGECIAIDDSQSLSTLMDGIRFERAPEGATPSHRTVMAYRQAGMFVSWLHDTDAAAFDRMMGAILDRRSFAEAVNAGYRRDVRSLWQNFAEGTN